MNIKELSIEEKAKRFDEALKEAVIAHKDEDRHLKATLERIFPELKESEDERMIQYFKDLAPFDKADELYEKYGFSHKDAIAWLEKQGGHVKFINGIQVGDKVTRNEDGVLVNLSQLNRVAKHDDKVNPKFHEGEWITNGDYTWKIVEVKPLDYILQSQDGNIVDDTISHVDEQFHSFTIEDAKDGDVLVASDGSIFLFAGIVGCTCKHYVALTTYGDVKFNEGLKHCWENSSAVYPATKEQYDALKKAIADAGYTFDFEKKELKKIEQKPWSEEDEKLFNRICDLIHGAAYENCETDEDGKELGEYAKMMRLLKSLKDRVQPKQEWIEKDEKTWEELIEEVKDQIDSVTAPDCLVKEDEKVLKQLNKWLTWLNSLKDRYTWKPTEEQMKALSNALSLAKNCGEESAFDLSTLYEQLKRL